MEEDEKRAQEKAAEDKAIIDAAKLRRETEQQRALLSGKPVKTDAKQNLKEEALIKEQEKKEAERKIKEENDAVKRDIGALKVSIASLQDKASKNGEDVRKWFNLFDADKSNSLNQAELTNVLTHAGLKLPQKETTKIFRLLDANGNGKITYNEFCDVMYGKATPDYMTFVTKEREKAKKEDQLKELRQARAANIKSVGGDVGSSEVSRDDKLGKVAGMSSVMGKSAGQEEKARVLLVDDGDTLRVMATVKELLRTGPSGKPATFDDLLVLMGKPKFQKEDQVTLADFEACVRAAGGTGKLSAHEIKTLFRCHSVEPPKSQFESFGRKAEPYIPLRDFKDKFLPSLSWQSDTGPSKYEAAPTKKDGASETSRTESLAIDQILDGKRAGDVAKEKEEAKRSAQARKDALTAALKPVPEEGSRSDALSQDSRASKPIEDLVGAKWQDPRKKLANKQLAAIAEVKKEGGLTREALAKHDVKVNEQFYRQPQAVVLATAAQVEANRGLDQSLERFFREFCKALIEEANSAPKAREVASYVDHYGKTNAGFLCYAEFKEIYQTHAQPILNAKGPLPEEGKLLALFNVFDVQSRGKIARLDFVSTVSQSAPALHLVERLGNKVRKGGERLVRALTEEFQEADAPFGCNGRLPLNNFQVIMNDYDLPLVQADLTDLEKRGYVHTDDLDCKFVDYPGVLALVKPKASALAGQPALLARTVVKLQAAWRGRKGRLEAARRRARANADLEEVGEVIQALRANDGGALAKATATKGAKAAGGAKGKQDPKQKESERKRREAPKAGGRARQQEADSLEAKMAAVVRPGKEGKHADKLFAARKEIGDYLRTTVIEHMIEAAFCYGESLGACRTVQRRFETRPVTKFLFPMVQEFQFGVQGVLPKSLQAVNQLGQVMCLDAEN